MADAIFQDPRLAEVYDPLDPDRSDLEPYLDFARHVGARSILDVGCGTGTFAVLLARHRFDVTGMDPAAASLDIARRKSGAERVRWIHGTAVDLPPMQVDLVTMTANVAQAIVDPESWTATLAAAFAALRPGGHFLFETRDPAARAWERWTPEYIHVRVDIDGVGAVERWAELTAIEPSLVSFRSITRWASDGAVLVSHSTLRFRERAEVKADLAAAGFDVVEVTSAPDRPGRELVFVAQRLGLPDPADRSAMGSAPQHIPYYRNDPFG